MAWDVAEPQDTTKIRSLGTVIRPNWTAIEQGESTFKPIALNYANRTPDPAANDPTAIADTYILYCKDDTGGDPELFGIDASSNIIQFTNGAPTLGTQGEVYLPGGILMQWDTVTAKNADVITFATPFSAAVYSVQATLKAGVNDFVSTLTYAAATFTVRLFDRTGVPDTTLRSLTYVAIGPA